MTRSIRNAIVLSLVVAGSGCHAFGCTNRVLWRVPSPDGRLVAVCQEGPVFDGPEFDLRLERTDGTLVRKLYHAGDADGCSEIVWSSDGGTLAVVTGHVARVRFVDVNRALQSDASTQFFWPQIDLSTEADLRLGKDLRFVDLDTVELTTCSYNIREIQRTGEKRCISPEARRRFSVPRS
jgi:hypothetical protein